MFEMSANVCFVCNKQLNATKTDTQKESIKRQIEYTEKQIDTLVYQLYGLTEEENAIVEGRE